MKKYTVLLTGYANVDGAAYTVQLFKLAGCEVSVFCEQNSWLLKNRDWDTWHELTDSNPAQYAKTVQDLTEQNKYDWVVLVEDNAIRILSEQISDEHFFKKIFPTIPFAHRELLGSKAGLSKLCNTHSLRTPAFAVYTGAEDPLVLATTIGFPVLLKIDKSGGGRGVFLVNNAADLATTFAALSDTNKHNLVFQKYIVGDNIASEALYKNKQLLGFTSAKVLKNLNGEFGISYERCYFTLPEMEPFLTQVGEKLGLDGFVNFTIMREHGSNCLYLVEADLRPHGWFNLCKFSGLDFSELIKIYLSPGNAQAVVQKSTTTIIIPFFSRHLMQALRQKNLKDLSRWIFNRGGYWQFVPWYDRKFFWSIIMEIIKTLVYPIAFLRPITKKLKKYFYP